jgi:radical SAM protein with 4Fe4S-binding SPASM domain
MVDELANLGCKTITLSGGEPLTRRDWPDIARAIRNRGMRLEMITNGLLVAEQADEIAAAGFFGVSFSVDGPADVHDALRVAPGSFAALVEGARTLTQKGVRIGAVTQVSRANVDHLPAIHDMLVANGFSGWQVQLTLPHGRAAKAMCLGPEELPALESTLAALIERGEIFTQAADTIGWMSRREPLVRSGTPRANQVWGGCQAGLRAVGITSDGTVRGCLSMPSHFDEGNVRTRSLRDIWNDPCGFAYNRGFERALLTGACADCAFGHICRAGCTCLAWTACGHTGENPYCLGALER